MADLDKRMQLNATKRKMKTFICTNSIKSLHYAQYCEGTENELRVHRESGERPVAKSQLRMSTA